MGKDLYKIECVDGEWTVRDISGWDTYYFGDSYRDCEAWIQEHNGEVKEITVY